MSAQLLSANHAGFYVQASLKGKQDELTQHSALHKELTEQQAELQKQAVSKDDTIAKLSAQMTEAAQQFADQLSSKDSALRTVQAELHSQKQACSELEAQLTSSAATVNSMSLQLSSSKAEADQKQTDLAAAAANIAELQKRRMAEAAKLQAALQQLREATVCSEGLQASVLYDLQTLQNSCSLSVHACTQRVFGLEIAFLEGLAWVQTSSCSLESHRVLLLSSV